MEAADIESRIDRIANLYAKLEELLDGLRDKVPHSVREFIKRKILDSQEMEELVRGIRDRRPPRFVLVGRTGVGKSSLVNAMCGKYLAQVSDVAVGTVACDRYSYKFMGKTIFEIVDTRGVGESLREGDRSAEDQLKSAVKEFRPDEVLARVVDRIPGVEPHAPRHGRLRPDRGHGVRIRDMRPSLRSRSRWGLNSRRTARCRRPFVRAVRVEKTG